MAAYLKKPYRSQLKMVYDVMERISESGQGEIISGISRTCNLSHYATISVIKPLMEHDLVAEKMIKRNHVFILTNNGFLFLNLCREFKAFLERFNIVNYFNT